MRPAAVAVDSPQAPPGPAHANRSGLARYAELDVLRGVAILAMIAYHAYIVSSWAGAIRPRLAEAALAWLQRPIPLLFIGVSGMSFSILCRRAAGLAHPHRALLRPVLRVGFAAGLVTLGSYVVSHQGYIRFGILHLIAASWVLALPLRNTRVGLAVVAAAILLAKARVGTLQVWSPWWVWLGFPYPGFATMDYFPVLPWFAVFLLGILAGRVIYRDGARPPWLTSPSEACTRGIGRVLAFAGRHALAIYLVHVPAIYALARSWVWLTR